MRIARIRRDGRPSVLVDVSDDGSVATVLEAVPPIADGETRIERILPHGALDRTLRRTAATVDVSAADVEWLPPVEEPRLIVCPGQNFAMHASESSFVSTPTRPSAFLRVPSTLVGHGAVVRYPDWATSSLDYEVEAAALLGVSGDGGRLTIVGMCLANDLSARDIQMEEAKAGSLLLSKNLPATLPLGPWVTTQDELPEIGDIEIVCAVNGAERQREKLDSMIYGYEELLSYWHALGLRAGDVMLSGTPAGVGIFREPPEDYLLKPGDEVRCHSPQLGTLDTVIGPVTHDHP